MQTPEVAAVNIRTAKRNIARELGLDVSKPFTHEERARFNRRLAEEIIKYPNSFTAEHQEQARLALQNPLQPLVDDSFSVADLAAETVNEGKTILPAISWNLFRLGSIVAVLWLLFLVGKHEPRRR